MPNYFLVSLSNYINLELCIKYALAGFTNSSNGFWTYLEIDEGDFTSFLYGAKAWNLYRVKSKAALKEARTLPPWPLVTFRVSRQTYYFPFRLHLEPVRVLQESLVRDQFAYVARNLLLRGGYYKTHFQADQTTLQHVSQMGRPYSGTTETLPVDAISFAPLIGFTKSVVNPPETYPFSELILQALIKKHLRNRLNLERFLSNIGLMSLANQPLEVLGELALPEGQVDAIIKEAVPFGTSNKIAIEVKLRSASIRDVNQLAQYVQAIGSECKAGVLIAEKASAKTISYAKEKGLHLLLYSLDIPLEGSPVSFPKLLSSFQLNQP
jgi:Endonuclease NucS